MPSIEAHLATVTVQYEVRGDPEDYASIAKLVQDAIRPALTRSPRDAEYPVIAYARLAGIEISNPAARS